MKTNHWLTLAVVLGMSLPFVAGGTSVTIWSNSTQTHLAIPRRNLQTAANV
jgi:hypothetical protein